MKKPIVRWRRHPRHQTIWTIRLVTSPVADALLIKTRYVGVNPCDNHSLLREEEIVATLVQYFGLKLEDTGFDINSN